jgi:hypothetical protein
MPQTRSGDTQQTVAPNSAVHSASCWHRHALEPNPAPTVAQVPGRSGSVAKFETQHWLAKGQSAVFAHRQREADDEVVHIIEVSSQHPPWRWHSELVAHPLGGQR